MPIIARAIPKPGETFDDSTYVRRGTGNSWIVQRNPHYNQDSYLTPHNAEDWIIHQTPHKKHQTEPQTSFGEVNRKMADVWIITMEAADHFHWKFFPGAGGHMRTDKPDIPRSAWLRYAAFRMAHVRNRTTPAWDEIQALSHWFDSARILNVDWALHKVTVEVRIDSPIFIANTCTIHVHQLDPRRLKEPFSDNCRHTYKIGSFDANPVGWQTSTKILTYKYHVRMFQELVLMFRLHNDIWQVGTEFRRHVRI